MRCGFRFLPGAMQCVNRRTREVTVSPIASDAGWEVLGARTIGYDTLFLTCRSKANDFGTLGVEQHCHFIDDL